jgi:hypothetical protein
MLCLQTRVQMSSDATQSGVRCHRALLVAHRAL